MKTDLFNEEILRTDVLCIGGGIAGLMAAIRAREVGAEVIVAEKGNTLHSGRGRAGNDHFWCYIPEVHGLDMEAFLKECLKGPKLRLMQAGTGMRVLRAFLEKSFDIVRLWDTWGIPMKYQGRWEFAGHSFPGDVLTHLKYGGLKQKRILTEKALEKGGKILNRVMIFDLLCGDDGIIGAIGINTREHTVIAVQAKAVILGTGFVDRLYPPQVPGWFASVAGGLTLTGDGRAMTYRAGADIVGPEIPRRHVGPRYFARYGQATWVGVLRDPQDKPIGPYVVKPDKTYGDMTPEVRGTLLEDYMKSGEGPVYMDCRGISDEDYEYMMYWMAHEGNTAILKHLEDEGIDIREHPIEFMTYEMGTMGGVYFNERGETSLKGLFAAGDEYHGGISCASTFGWIAGENAAIYAEGKDSSKSNEVDDEIEEKKAMIEKILARSIGIPWQEANIALQQTMFDYAGTVRSEQMLKAGYEHLKRIEKHSKNKLIAKNTHELVHCLEVFNLLDIGKLIFEGILSRKETRDKYSRVDYPFANPAHVGKNLFYKKGEAGPIVEWKRKASERRIDAARHK